MTNPIICCPTILNAAVNMYAVCKNANCNKKVNPTAGATTVSCNACNRTMLLKNALLDMNISIQLENEINNLFVTVFQSVLKEFFGEVLVGTFKIKPNLLVEKMLNLNQHDFVLSFNTNIVTSIKPHSDMDVENNSNHDAEEHDQGAVVVTTSQQVVEQEQRLESEPLLNTSDSD